MKNILITGATSGIGLATAKQLAQQADAPRLIITGTNADKMAAALAALPKDTLGILYEQNQVANLEGLVAEITRHNISLNGIFVNAGMAHFNAFSEVSEAELEEVMTVNFKSPFFLMQKLFPHMAQQCSIVLTGSIVTQKAFANTGVYTASKAALESLAKVLNEEWRDRKIRVNVLAPGVTLTPIFARSGMEQAAINALEEDHKTATVLGRILYPEDIAHAATFLLSSCSEAMRNARLVIDGGMSE